MQGLNKHYYQLEVLTEFYYLDSIDDFLEEVNFMAEYSCEIKGFHNRDGKFYKNNMMNIHISEINELYINTIKINREFPDISELYEYVTSPEELLKQNVLEKYK